MKTGQRGLPAYADGGVVHPYSVRGIFNSAKKLFESDPPETMTQKYARQDAERAAKNPPKPVETPPAEKPDVVDKINARNKLLQGLKDGGAVKAGIIRGPGTGTSDSIKGTMPVGSFVMPKDSTDVMVSNGETNFTPEMVQSIGAAALMAAKGMTHTPVAEQSDAKFANGGVVDEEKKPMGYGEQMRNLGSALVSAPIEAAKTIVSAPGYGFNKESIASTPTPSAAVQPSAPSYGITPSAAGAGRGFVNQALVNPSAPAPASPLTKVDIGNGITKTTGGSSPLFSNVGDADNASLMGRGKVSAQNQLAMNGIQARQDTADKATQQRLQYESEVNDATKFREGQAQAGIQRRALNGNRNALALLQGQVNDATARRGQDIQAAGQTATSQNAAARLGIDRTTAGLNNQATQQKISAGQQMQDLQAKLLAAKPEERAGLEMNLRAMQGDYAKPAQDKYSHFATDDGNGGKSGVVYNERTGQTVGQQQSPAAPPQAAAMLKSNPKLAAEFDAKYGAGASSRILGQK